MSYRYFLAFAALASCAVPAFAQRPCEGLTSLAIAGLTVNSATSVAAGPFTLPSAGARNVSVEVPAFCRVAGTIAPEIRFELWMPAQWNRKFLTVGNGGLAGSISYAPMVAPLKLGYATSSTDTGHQAGTNDGSWAQGHFERVVDFAHRAIHTLAETDKAVLQAFYGNAPGRSYFSGCSAGGEQAMQEAQRYPRDFDGIIAGDPANNWVHHYIGGHLWAALAMDGDGYIPASKVQLLADAVNETCDALDGIKDGVLNDPRRCHFDPAVLACKQGDAPTCLTNAQVQSVKKLWAGVRSSDGDMLYPGLVPGGEAGPGGWANWITGPGTTTFNMLDALDQWSDRGVAPDKIIASHLSNGVANRTRPLCPYPMEAQWTGSGSTDKAENFVCALPSAP